MGHGDKVTGRQGEEKFGDEGREEGTRDAPSTPLRVRTQETGRGTDGLI